MLTIKGVQVFGIERSLIASGNPMTVGEINTLRTDVELVDSDINRGRRLGGVPTGTGHDNFLKGIIVQFDVKYPQYWTPEAQRYHWFDIISSQSKMHRLMMTISEGEGVYNNFNKYVDKEIVDKIVQYVVQYNIEENREQKYFWFMKALSNLPMGYEMWETISTNYLQLKTMYFQRQNHKLKEDWGEFITFCDGLPLFRNLILKDK